MPQDENAAFPHIVVTPDDDDDIVIQAGIPHSSPKGSPNDSAAETPFASDEPDASFNADETPVEPSKDEVVEKKPREPSDNKPLTDKSSHESSAANAQNTANGTAKASSDKTSKEDDYHETTLEDIENSKMSTTQKVIIVLAIVLIIGFIIYYFVH